MGLTNSNGAFSFERKASISLDKTRSLDFNNDPELLVHKDAIILELKKNLLINRFQTYDFSLIKLIVNDRNLSYKYSINSPKESESNDNFNNGLSIYTSDIKKTPVINSNTLIDSSLSIANKMSHPIKFWIFHKKSILTSGAGHSHYYVYYLCAPIDPTTKFLNYNCYSSASADSIDIQQFLKYSSEAEISEVSDAFGMNDKQQICYPVNMEAIFACMMRNGQFQEYQNFSLYLQNKARTHIAGKQIPADFFPSSTTDADLICDQCLWQAVSRRIYRKYNIYVGASNVESEINFKAAANYANFKSALPIRSYYYYNRYENTDGRNNYFYFDSTIGCFKLGENPIIQKPAGTYTIQINAFPRVLDTSASVVPQKTTYYDNTKSYFYAISSLPLKEEGPFTIKMKPDPHQPYFSDLIDLMNYYSVNNTSSKNKLQIIKKTTPLTKDNVWDSINPTNDNLYLNQPTSTYDTWNALRSIGFVDDVKYFADSPEIPFENVTYNVMRIAHPNLNASETEILNSIRTELVNRGHIPSDAYALSPLNLQDNKKPTLVGQRCAAVIATENIDSRVFVYTPTVFFSNEERDTDLFSENKKISIEIPPPKIDPITNMPVKRYVKVKRLSHETLSSLISKSISLEKITEIIPQNFSYPFSAIVGTKIDSRAFSQIPVRTFDCKLKKVLVPSNYFPNNENGEDLRYLNAGKNAVIYDGDWDGTFKLSWTNNPAWVLMDILINKRYGLGNYIESEQIDIWELYKIARWCDAVDENGKYLGVPDAYGGIEPRHAFNAIIKDKFNVFDMINQIASVFRGNVYYMNSLITFEDDRPKDPIGEFNNSDVKDGLFNYANHKKDDEYTAVDVLYNDEKDNFKPKIEFVEDPEGIRKRGILKKEINAFGITSKSQARRMGMHFLHQTSKENLNVSFTTDLKALLYRPGDLISINDELLNSRKNFGTIKYVEARDATSFRVTIDQLMDPEIFDNKTISLHIPKIKPKYEDLLYKSEFYPDSLTIENLNFIEEYFKKIQPVGTSYRQGFLCHKNVLLPLLNQADGNKSYTGILKGYHQVTQGGSVKTINFETKINFNYIACCNMNCQVSEYGHWEVCTGIYSESDYFFKIDSLRDPLIKFELPHKKYFFEYVDTGAIMKCIKTDSFGNKVYSKDTFSITNSTSNNLNASYQQFNVSNYSNRSIKFQDIIEFDKPSIESFEVLQTETGWVNNDGQTPYSILVLSKYGKIESTNDLKIKTSVDTEIKLNDILIGSPYSMSFKNQNDKIFKIISINEEYINEYSIFATEYDPNKFYKIESSSAASLLSIHNTFNYLYAYEAQKIQTGSENLKSPIIETFSAIESNKSLLVQWKGVPFAEKYKIYLKTPSKQTNNFQAEVLYNDTSYNQNLNLYSFKMSRPSEIGTFTITIEAYKSQSGETMAKFSPPASRSLNLLEY